MADSYTDELRRQVHASRVRGMNKDEIAAFYKIERSQVDKLLEQAYEMSAADNELDERLMRQFLLDQLDGVIYTCYARLSQMEKVGAANKSQNTSQLLAQIRGAVETKAKILGFMQTKVVGADNGPIMIADATDRQNKIEEIKKMLEQSEMLGSMPTNTYILENHGSTED